MSPSLHAHARSAPPTLAPHPISIQTFGRFECRQHHIIPTHVWRSQRTIDLFFVLLTSPHQRLRRATIGDLLWPHLASDAALNNVRVALHRLRHVFADAAPNLVYADQTTIGLEISPHVTVDCDVFFQTLRRSRQHHDDKLALPLLRQALNLYHGEFMADQPVSEWNHQQRLYYHNEYLAASLRIGHILWKQRLYNELIERMWALLQHEHEHPEAQQLLMAAYQHHTPSQLPHPTRPRYTATRPLTP